MRLIIWDLPTRLFHWLLALCVTVCAVSGFLLPTPWLRWHFWAGYAIGGLLLFRLAWACGGPEHSRWSGFLPAPSAVLRHLRDLAHGTPRRHLGHNPAGGVMILALLSCLSLLVCSGLAAQGGMFRQGPLAFALSFADGRAIKEAHEAIAMVLLALAGLHVCGVLAESFLLKENLVITMLSGRKQLYPNDRSPSEKRPWATALAVSIVIAAGISVELMARLPVAGWHPLTPPAVYAKECGACHDPYHPSLLDKASWSKILGGLDDHFGQDAALLATTTDQIEQWLSQEDSTHWDTLASHVFQQKADSMADPAITPLPITDNPWWKRKHRHISDTIFAQKAVRSRSNCSSCHGDAEQGLFAPQAIAIPKEDSK